MTDSPDQAQASVFIAVLCTEIAAVSLQVEESERSAQTAWESGQASARLWHVEAARSQRNTLYELHRQLDALHDRFPGTADTPLTSRKLSAVQG
ncbi:MAG: hypothetical protein WBD41_15895 [Rhodococcus sp. (in: high G+C Gram-positive bacteria)]|jgi:hypothetical protein